MPPLAATLRARRLAHGLSRERLAWMAGVSSSTIERIEMHGHFPRADRLVAIARALGATVEELVAEDVA